MTLGEARKLPEAEPADIWTLPKIIEVEVQQVRYPEGRFRAIGPEVVQVEGATEVRIRTDGDIPDRALAPSLHLGEVELTHGEKIGPGSYVFYAYGDEGVIDEKVSAMLGWAEGASPHPPQSD